MSTFNFLLLGVFLPIHHHQLFGKNPVGFLGGTGLGARSIRGQAFVSGEKRNEGEGGEALKRMKEVGQSVGSEE